MPLVNRSVYPFLHNSTIRKRKERDQDIKHLAIQSEQKKIKRAQPNVDHIISLDVFLINIFYSKNKLGSDNLDQMSYVTFFFFDHTPLGDEVSHRQHVTLDKVSFRQNGFRPNIVDLQTLRPHYHLVP